jgi:uncharacterized delta-60 repeat protein
MKKKINFITIGLFLATIFSIQVISTAQNGSLDLTFDKDGIVTTSVGSSNDYGNTVAIQSDGKILVAGDHFNGFDFDIALVRYFSNGILDNTFGNVGKITLNIGNNNDYGNAVAIQSDGKIVVVGSSFNGTDYEMVVARFDENGALDNTFNADGILTITIGSSAVGNSVSIHSDGKIVVAGTCIVNFNNDIAVVRLNSNGTFDNTFDNDGKQYTDIAAVGVSDDDGRSVVIQSDGKIVIVGSSKSGINKAIAVIRYNADGSLDNTFDIDGKIITNFNDVGSYNDSGNSVAIQNDGKIVVVGSIDYGNTDIAVLRINSNGSFDNTFDTDGKLRTAVNSFYDIGISVAIQSNNKIVLVAKSNISDFAVIRINSNGILDNTFDNDWKVLIPLGSPDDEGGSLVIQSDGKIVIAGSVLKNTNDHDIGVTRLSTNGSLDGSFDNDGSVSTYIGSYEDFGNSIVIQSDGKIVATGISYNGTDFDIVVIRYNKDGSLDKTFDSDGIVTTPVGNSSDYGTSIAIQADGKIVVAGYSSGGFHTNITIIRYNNNGTLDTTFDTDGMVSTNVTNFDNFGFSLAIQADGRIVVAGTSLNGNGFDYDIVVVRFNINGSLDTSFDNDGSVTTAGGGFLGSAVSIAIQNDGKIVVVGSGSNGANRDIFVVRFNENGSLDNTFDNDGIINTSVGSSDDFGVSLAIQTDGKILVTGYSMDGIYSDISVVRYNKDGTLDNTFSTDGKLTTSVSSFDDFSNSIVLQNDGKILVAGYGNFFNSNSDIVVVRYNRDGSLDSTFDNDGVLTTSIGSFSGEYAKSVAIQADSKIVVAGTTNANADNDIVIVRYNNIITGLNYSVKQNIELDIQPNPFFTSTTIYTSNFLNKATLTIYNSLGEQVEQIKEINGQEIILYRANLPSGLYSFQLTENNEILATNKLLISE